jgi:hypothetical protein
MTTLGEKLSDEEVRRGGRYYDFLNIFAEKMAFLTRNKAKLCKILIITLVFEKNANFSPKIVKNRRKLWS